MSTPADSAQPGHTLPFRSGWREDIAGLRGVAVLLVVLYHAGVPGFSGGYIGVDVFFALSGYLITGILATEARTRGRIDLPRFYARRAKRLLPAAFVLLVSVMAVSVIAYAPAEQVLHAPTAIATAAYASNLLFSKRATDYLAEDAATDPLLHTWSLAVEEQFYVVWPMLLVLLLFGWTAWRGVPALRVRRAAWGLGVVTLMSFALTVVWMQWGQAHWAFFASPARAWEFGAGGLAALVPRFREKRQRAWLHPAMGWLGLVLIVASGMVYTAATPFPGTTALVPIAGTVLILRSGAFGPDGAVQRLLSIWVLRKLGALSYSWYLWHWPVLVIAAALLGDLSLLTRLTLAIASLGPAWFSFRFVEDPIRRSRRLGSRSRYGLVLLLVLTAIALALAFGWRAFGRAQMDAPDQRRYRLAGADISALYARGCHDDYPVLRPTACIDEFAPQTDSVLAAIRQPETARAGARETVVLFGDSHAAQWSPVVEALGLARGWRVVYLTKSGCPGLITPIRLAKQNRPYIECDQWRSAVFDTLRALRPTLVVHAPYHAYPLSEAEWQAGTSALADTLATLAPSVVLLEDPPRAPSNVVYCLARHAWHRRLGLARSADAECAFPAASPGIGIARRAQRRAAAASETVVSLSLTDVICPAGICVAESDGLIRYRDAHHLGATYAATLTDAFATRLDSVLRTTAPPQD